MTPKILFMVLTSATLLVLVTTSSADPITILPKPTVMATAELTRALARRDYETLDLEVVGAQLVIRYGRFRAIAAVVKVWDDLTDNAPLDRAKDFMLLAKLPGELGRRTRDVAWLIAFPDGWAYPVKPGRP